MSSTTQSVNSEVKQFTGEGALRNKDEIQNNDDDNEQPPLRKAVTAESVLQRVQTSLSFFHPQLGSMRKRIWMQAILVFLVMGGFMLAIFSLYWGSMFNKDNHQKYMKYAIYVDDDGVIGSTILDVVRSMPQLGKWHVFNNNITEVSKFTGEEAIKDLVHRQKYWGGVYLATDATKQWVNCINNGLLPTPLIDAFYESGRDMQTVPNYVTGALNKVEEKLLLLQPQMIDLIRLQLPDPVNLTVVSAPLLINKVDMAPLGLPVVVAPLQVGLIYMVIITFFQFNFFGDLNMEVASTKIKMRQYLIYRLVLSNVCYFWLLLCYSLVTLAFQVSFTRTYGKAGFVVYWMTNFMTMISVGATNEVAAHLLLMIWPPLLGFWLIAWVISNVSPSYTPMTLTANYYRYGYAMPIHNAYEITKVILFDTSPALLGRSYGILVIWVVLANVALVVVLPIFGRVMGKRAQAEKKKIIDQYKESIGQV